MTAARVQPPRAQPRPDLKLVDDQTPTTAESDPSWSDAACSGLGEPLAEAAVLGCLLRTTGEHAAALLAAFVDEGA